MVMIDDNLQQVRTQLRVACTDCGRNPDEVRLLAVSKTQAPQAVRLAYAAGQRAFGENYVQEGVEKIGALADLQGIEWHMIGPVQSNKTRVVAENFSWVQSLDRLKTAERLSAQRPDAMPALQVCLQVNIDGGANKSGVVPSEALALAAAVASLPRLQLRGIMVIPEPTTDLIAAKQVLTWTKALFLQIKALYPGCDTLSMGMSADMALAVQHGSTMVRVGSAIFGARVASSKTVTLAEAIR
jgi:PLP dependent protein